MFVKIFLSILLSEMVFSLALDSSNSDRNIDLKASKKQFLVSNETANFYAAIVKCKQSGMELASITNQQEQSDLDFVLLGSNMESGYDDGFWLSAINLVNPDDTQQYYWLLDGSVALYTNWCPTQPDSVAANNCAEILLLTTGNICWGNTRCAKQLRYVCQTVEN